MIGLAGPFSQQTGQSMQLAAQLAVAELNQRGGVSGRPIQLVVRDDSGSVSVAVRVARSFYDSPDVAAVIGHMGSAATLAAARVYNSGDTPIVSISPSASSPDLSQAGPYTFRVCPDDRVHGSQLADWAYRGLQARRVAVLYENDAYGRGLRTAFRSSFTELGGRIVSEDPFSPALPGFEPYLTRIRIRGGADAILIAGALDGGQRMLNTLNSLQFNPTVLGGDGIGGIETANVGAEGVFVSLAYLHEQPGARNEAFRSAYGQMYGEQLPDHRGAGAYDIVYLLGQAIEQVGTDRTRIRDYLAGLGTETEGFEGVTGSIGFDSNGDVVDRNVVIGVVRNRRLVSAERR
ncbi:MAG: branched-chain amino acid ABC transporter substrate-binding protein [Gemmatimonadota bacterium]|nr:MAG: branched-chain amino acid ABC transporter substrate-binding protein [Gemmatimonadota bacterium]